VLESEAGVAVANKQFTGGVEDRAVNAIAARPPTRTAASPIRNRIAIRNVL
jgi:hypothetical protein